MIDDALPKIGAPALRALASIGVTSLSQLTSLRVGELPALHGFGPRPTCCVMPSRTEASHFSASHDDDTLLTLSLKICRRPSSLCAR